VKKCGLTGLAGCFEKTPRPAPPTRATLGPLGRGAGGEGQKAFSSFLGFAKATGIRGDAIVEANA